MNSILRAIFGTSGRRLVALIVSNAAFYAGAYGIHHYIDHVAGSPAITFVLVALWMGWGALNALVTVVSLGNLLLYPGHTEDFLRDEMAELDAKISADPDAKREETEDDDAAVFRRGDGGFRFGIYVVALAAVHVLLSNTLSDGFLNRYSHPGGAVIHMRNEDPAVRRTGLNMLAERLDFTSSPQVDAVVIRALEDPDEGVAARATFVAGMLGIEGAVPRLAQLATENEALTFSTLIALGQVGGEPAAKAARALADSPIARKEPRALAYMLGLLRVRAIERLREIYDQAEDDETRTAAIWALGRLREPRLLDFIGAALKNDGLVVRCAAAEALGDMTVYETSPLLRAAFEKSNDPLERCPEVTLPVQEGGTKFNIVKYRLYQLVLIRALATTDDPELLKWLVKNQEGVESRTHKLMQKLYERLVEKDKTGQLNQLKRHVRLQKIKAEAAPEALVGTDASVDETTPDGGAGDAAVRP